MNCPQCTHKLTPCYNGNHQLRAWWCRSCGYIDKAIGRERLININTPLADKG